MDEFGDRWRIMYDANAAKWLAQRKPPGGVQEISTEGYVPDLRVMIIRQEIAQQARPRFSESGP